MITKALSIAFAAGLMVSACKKTDKPAAGSGSNVPAAAAADPTLPSDIGPDSVGMQFTGKYEKGDNPADEFPVFTITNKSTHKLFYIKAWHYFYDKDKKQLRREFEERSVGTIEPGQAKDIAFGSQKAKQPPGTETIEAAFVGANFSDKIEFKGKVADLAPDQRPMKGS